MPKCRVTCKLSTKRELNQIDPTTQKPVSGMVCDAVFTLTNHEDNKGFSNGGDLKFVACAFPFEYGQDYIMEIAPAESPNERMKVQVTILDRDLRADGVRVAVFKQQTSPRGGGWVDAQVDPRTNIDIENAILTRARQLRIAGGS